MWLYTLTEICHKLYFLCREPIIPFPPCLLGPWETAVVTSATLYQRRAQMTSRKFTPWCDSDKETIPWATSLRATYGTTALVNSSARYSAINFTIRWPLELKMLAKTHDMYRGIIKMRSLKEGGKIWWASHVWRLFTNTLLTFMAEKNITIVPDIQVYHPQESQQAS